MPTPITLLEHPPTTPEYLSLIASVGWRPRDPAAVTLALRHSLYAVCAHLPDDPARTVIACGRVIGDAALHL